MNECECCEEEMSVHYCACDEYSSRSCSCSTEIKSCDEPCRSWTTSLKNCINALNLPKLKRTQACCNCGGFDSPTIQTHNVKVTLEVLDKLKQDMSRVCNYFRKFQEHLPDKKQEIIQSILVGMMCKISHLEYNALQNGAIVSPGDIKRKQKRMLHLIKCAKQQLKEHMSKQVDCCNGQLKLMEVMRQLGAVDENLKGLTRSSATHDCLALLMNKEKQKTVNRSQSYHRQVCLEQVSKEKFTNKITPEMILNKALVPGSKKSDVSAVNVVYTKTRVSVMGGDGCTHDNKVKTNKEKEVEMSLNRQGINKTSDSNLQLQVKVNGVDDLNLSENKKVKENVKQISSLWFESAKQLLDIFK